MNIGDKFYCSSCLEELPDEGVCPYCGYDPASPLDPEALEEGTILNGMQYQIGAVKRKTDSGYVYGAFDYVRQRLVFIREYFPGFAAKRNLERGDQIEISKGMKAEFEAGKEKFLDSGGGICEIFEENGTVYMRCLNDQNYL